MFDAWMLAAIEDAGLTDKFQGIVSRAARYFVNCPEEVIDTVSFKNACVACNADPYSFDEKDFKQLQAELDELV